KKQPNLRLTVSYLPLKQSDTATLKHAEDCRTVQYTHQHVQNHKYNGNDDCRLCKFSAFFACVFLGYDTENQSHERNEKRQNKCSNRNSAGFIFAAFARGNATFGANYCSVVYFRTTIFAIPK